MVDQLDNLTSSEQLKRLLLEEEQERIEHLEVRLGDDNALKDTLTPIIADVLRNAGVRDYRRLAGALAPIVLQSIKTEIQSSRDMMVDALYPITGQLVAAAVRNAFKDLVDQLNNRLDSTLSIDRWRAKFKAAFSGRSEAEILLSEGAAFELLNLLLINRQTGLLLAQASTDTNQSDTDSHILSSILTAIMAFVRDAMSRSNEQDLRTLHVGDVRLHLQVSPCTILAIKTKGPPPAGFETALSKIFYAFLSRWGHALSEPNQMESHDEMALAEDLDERFQSLLKAKQNNFRSPSKKGIMLLGSLAVMAIAWLGSIAYRGWVDDQIETRAHSLIAQHHDLRGYPINAHYQPASNVLTMSGLFPNHDALLELRRDLERSFPNIALSLDVSKLPAQTVDPKDILTMADLSEWQDVARSELISVLNHRLSTLSETVSLIEQRLPTKDEAEHAALRFWLDRQSIQFVYESEFRNEAEANNLLREIADRFSQLPVNLGLRIIGYGDDLGEDAIRARVSKHRADLVANQLARLGMPSERLEVVERGNEKRIGSNDGASSINRRVEFEVTTLVEESVPDDALREDDSDRH